jgi:hypothetical protein
MQQNWINVNGVTFYFAGASMWRIDPPTSAREHAEQQEIARMCAEIDADFMSHAEPSHVSEAQSLTDRDKQMLQSLRIRWE